MLCMASCTAAAPGTRRYACGQPGDDVELTGHPGLVQALRIVDVLVAEAVDGAHDHAGRREPGQVGLPGGGGIGRDFVGAVQVAEIGPPTELV